MDEIGRNIPIYFKKAVNQLKLRDKVIVIMNLHDRESNQCNSLEDIGRTIRERMQGHNALTPGISVDFIISMKD